MDVRPASLDDVGAAAETLARAFRSDPVWGVALEGRDGASHHLRSYWRLYIEGARRYGTVFVSGVAATVSVWIPPGETELSDEQEFAMRALVEDTLVPARASALFELWDRFADNHRHDQPHAYLSLLATHPALAGHGYGQAHLAADVARWDVCETPTYLESSNPANNHRYERLGYTQIGKFNTVLDGAVVTTMWRPVGG